METKQTSPVAVGGIISLVLIIISLVIYFLNMYTQSWIQYFGFVVTVAGIIWGVTNHGKEMNHSTTFGQLFSFGFKVTSVIICIMILYTLLSNAIFPDIKEKIMEAARTQQLKAPNADEDKIEQGMNMFSQHYTLFIILSFLFSYLIIGCISSLIGAAITKKRPQQTFDQI